MEKEIREEIELVFMKFPFFSFRNQIMEGRNIFTCNSKRSQQSFEGDFEVMSNER